MKSYWAILLSAFGLSFLISTYAPEVKQDVLNTPTYQEQSVELLAEKTATKKVEISEPTEKVAVSAPKASSGQGYTITKVVDSLVPNPNYRDIYRTGRLVYAHNSDNLFGKLRFLKVGSEILLSENGVSTSYTISGVGHFMKVPYTNSKGMKGENLVKCDASYNNCSAEVWMGALVSNAMGHKLAMMTCDGGAGTPYRLIIFLD